jgi:TATA-box binding protein (TBP) (component of TFIID and TFIIIB)
MNDQPSPYRVSTITCNASISTKVSLEHFFEHVRIHPDLFVWSEYGAKTKGTRPKKRKGALDENGNKKDKKYFDNQVTVIFRMQDGYYPNVKLFRNGNVQMTGIRSPSDGEQAVKTIASEVVRIAREHEPAIVENIADVVAKDFMIRMINCDFGFPYKIRRKNLHQIIISEYENVCSFQPLTYPGVKLQYFWNQDASCAKQGICHCKKECFGKGKGNGEGECKKVTIAIFDSGKILITGANSFDQVNAAYRYICDLVQRHKSEVQKVLPAIVSP